MVNVSAFIIYLTVFRLSIVAAGVVSIVLGYRLFSKGIFQGNGGESTTVDAHIGANRFRLANAAPGTCFALFGVVIISAMLFSGRPEMTLEMLHGVSKQEKTPAAGDRKVSLAMRGDTGCDLTAAIEKGRQHERRGEVDQAIGAYSEAVSFVALPLNYLAWLYHSEGEHARALPLARMAVQLLPEDANCLDTLAEIEYQAGAYEKALALMERASRIDPKYQGKLGRFRLAGGKPPPGAE